MTTRNVILCSTVFLICGVGVLVALTGSSPAVNPDTPPTDLPAVQPPAPAPAGQPPAGQPATSLQDSSPVAAGGGSSDHTMFGGTLSRNMVNKKDTVAKFPKEGPKWDDEES